MTGHLASYLIGAADVWGGRPACADAKGRHTYNDYLRESLRVAALLHGVGVAPGDRVCISAPRSFPVYASIFGTLMLNACYVPIDYATQAARARRIVEDCAPAALITTRRNLERLLGADPAEDDSDGLVAARLGFGPLRAEAIVPWTETPAGLPPAMDRLDPSRPAYILYTSGSTGEPKGVVHTHDSASAFVEWAVAQLAVTEQDTIAQVASPSFDLSVFDIFGAARAGAMLAPIHETAVMSLARFCRAVAAGGATLLYCVPSALLRDAKAQDVGWRELAAAPLRHIVLAGEPINAPALRRLKPFLETVGLHNWYGPTETNVCCAQEIGADDLAGDSIPIGRPCPYARLAFAWDEGDASVGELLVAGDTVMAGYWNRPEATAAAMHEEGGVRYYRTGDFVRFNAEDELMFLGRRDRQVKVRGHRVQLDELELTLQKHLPNAEFACAVVKPDGADPVIAAAVTGGEEGIDAQVRALASEHLPPFMIPEAVFVIDALPRNDRGKIDYAGLESRLSEAYRRAR